MRILIAPDKFKGSLTAEEVVRAMSRGIRRVLSRVRLEKMPLADGGDGTAGILIRKFKARKFSVQASDPLGRRHGVDFGMKGSTAFMDFADVCGLRLLSQRERNPMRTTSRGVGEMILRASERGARRIYLGVGGSATVDGGIGALKALGIRLLDANGREVSDGGSGLKQIRDIDVSGCLLKRMEIVILSDVQNPLLGRLGAARVFGPQKGATPWMVRELDAGLRNFSKIIQKDCRRKVGNLSAGGAAGGIVAGFAGVLGSVKGVQVRVVSGIGEVLRLLRVEMAVKGSDLILTGEGHLDSQTLGGKTVSGIAGLARRHRKPLVVFAGKTSLSPAGMKRAGIMAAWEIAPRGVSEEKSIRHAAKWLESSVSRNLGKYLNAIF